MSQTHTISFEDHHGITSATIAPERGFNCISFKVPETPSPAENKPKSTFEVLDTLPGFMDGSARPSSSGIPILFPFPNRIKEGKFTWDDKQYQLPLNGKTHAIHGFVFDRPWRVTDHSAHAMTGEFQLSKDAPDRLELWPTDFILRVTYTVASSYLHSRFEIVNPTEKPLPWGLGTHSYFRLSLAQDDVHPKTLIQAPIKSQWVLKENIPTGEIIPVPANIDLSQSIPASLLKLDDVFTDLQEIDEKIVSHVIDEHHQRQLIQSTGPEFRELVVFTPPQRGSICLEPYTCTTDAINLSTQGFQTGWQVLAPGQIQILEISHEVRPL
jgi:aldose 1-epimerase